LIVQFNNQGVYLDYRYYNRVALEEKMLVNAEVKGKQVMLTPFDCHCTRCHHQWQTRNRGGSHKYPKQCSNAINCGSPYWDMTPMAWLKPSFDPNSIRKKDGTICRYCLTLCIKERRRLGLDGKDSPETDGPSE
jgi:hypothetical protein